MEINKRITVNQPINKLWQILAVDFAKLGEWTTTVDASRPLDGITSPIANAPVVGRVCSARAFGEVKETISRYDERNKVLSYTAEAGGILRMVNGIENTWSLLSLGRDTTEVTSRIVANLMGVGVLLTPLMKLQINRVADTALQELKYYAETGMVHPRKVKVLHKAGRGPATM